MELRSVLVVGATGPLGLEFTQQALDQGLRIFSLARRPLSISHPQVTHIQGDVAEPEVAKQAVLCGADAAFITLGLFHWRDATMTVPLQARFWFRFKAPAQHECHLFVTFQLVATETG